MYYNLVVENDKLILLQHAKNKQINNNNERQYSWSQLAQVATKLSPLLASSELGQVTWPVEEFPPYTAVVGFEEVQPQNCLA